MQKSRLYRNSSVPLYAQLKSLLISKIEQGDFDQGPIPPETKIAKEYNVSRTTVRLAMDALVKDGYITRQRGRGSFVIPIKTRIVGNKFYSLYDDFRASNRVIETKVVDFEIQSVPPRIVQLFGLQDAHDFYIADLLRISDGVPFLISTVYIPCTSKYLIEPGYFEVYGSAINLFEEEFNVKIVGASRSIEAVKSNPYEAELLGIEINNPLLLTKTIIYDEKGDPVYYAKSRYRADHYQYYIPFLPREPIQAALIERDKG
jgi:GntR family transcriptional regulator